MALSTKYSAGASTVAQCPVVSSTRVISALLTCVVHQRRWIRHMNKHGIVNCDKEHMCAYILWFQTHAPALAAPWVLGIWAQVLRLTWQSISLIHWAVSMACVWFWLSNWQKFTNYNNKIQDTGSWLMKTNCFGGILQKRESQPILLPGAESDWKLWTMAKPFSSPPHFPMRL